MRVCGENSSSLTIISVVVCNHPSARVIIGGVGPSPAQPQTAPGTG